MAVCADNAVARADKPLFGQKCVLDAHLSYVIEVFDLLALRKFARALDLACRLDVLIGREVVHDKRDLALVFDVTARLLHFANGDGRGDVVGEREIELRLDELSLRDVIESRVRGKDLLRHGHSHMQTLLFFEIILTKVYHMCYTSVNHLKNE